MSGFELGQHRHLSAAGVGLLQPGTVSKHGDGTLVHQSSVLHLDINLYPISGTLHKSSPDQQHGKPRRAGLGRDSRGHR